MKDASFPPVGDIKLSKAKGTYNTYKLELSYGQLEAIRQALKKDHANPISDELLTMFDYYTQNIPGPGEEEENVKERQAGAEAAEEDFPIPMPPGQKSSEPAKSPGKAVTPGSDQDEIPTEDLPDLPQDETGGEAPGGAGEGGDEFGELFSEEPEQTSAEEADNRLPEPPER